jgi:hypothetical protein
MAPMSFQCFLTGRPVGMVPLPRLVRRASRISCKVASDDKDKLRSGGNVLGMKLGKLAMVALAVGVLALGPVDGIEVAKYHHADNNVSVR